MGEIAEKHEWTYNDIMASLENASEITPPGYFSCLEWADKLHVSVTKMHDILRQFKLQNRIAVAHRTSYTVDNRAYREPLYALLRGDHNG